MIQSYSPFGPWINPSRLTAKPANSFRILHKFRIPKLLMCLRGVHSPYTLDVWTEGRHGLKFAVHQRLIKPSIYCENIKQIVFIFFFLVIINLAGVGILMKRVSHFYTIP